MVGLSLENSPGSLQSKLKSTFTGKKPWHLVSSAYDKDFRPVIRTLADAFDTINRAGLEPIGVLRGGAAEFVRYRGMNCAFVWIDGETPDQFFRVIVPFSGWFRGKDQNNRACDFPIAAFHDATILRTDQSVRLREKENLWIDRVEFDLSPMPFVLTETQKLIAELVCEYLNLAGHNLPTKKIAYARLCEIELPSLQAVVDFVQSHWGQRRPAPSRETIAGALEAFHMRPRSGQRK